MTSIFKTLWVYAHGILRPFVEFYSTKHIRLRQGFDGYSLRFKAQAYAWRFAKAGKTGIYAFFLSLFSWESQAIATVLPSGLEYVEIVEGTGPTPQIGDTVVVRYTGWLENGKKFDTTEGKDPFQFRLGKGDVIPGWDEGLQTMKKGGRRKLIIPAELAYGKKGASPVIPPDAKLTFEVKLVDIKKGN